ncbi:phage holin family protein [Metabacillus litoralis]|uniref:Phage holin family protein n=1 Tax=Metabacillus litoralis TaxID=152268 RepID=A0A5C6VZK3_9BACI|nr:MULTISPECIES: phage holin family protein [Metabacillus]MBM7606172.1 putative membrane protein [Metabacillus crassostreae]TXC91039.1 phage holin family protein [Metabacillus litoralis]
MVKWIVSILVNALILIVVAGFFDSFHLSGIGAALGASFILSVLNVLIKPFLILLTLPVTVLTLGLFLFVINAITLMITEGLMGDSFVIEGFGTALIAAIFISLLHLMIQKGIVEPMKKSK